MFIFAFLTKKWSQLCWVLLRVKDGTKGTSFRDGLHSSKSAIVIHKHTTSGDWREALYSPKKTMIGTPYKSSDAMAVAWDQSRNEVELDGNAESEWWILCSNSLVTTKNMIQFTLWACNCLPRETAEAIIFWSTWETLPCRPLETDWDSANLYYKRYDTTWAHVGRWLPSISEAVFLLKEGKSSIHCRWWATCLTYVSKKQTNLGYRV